MTSDSEHELHGQSSRKRQRASAPTRTGKDGDESKKARGRPRVEAQDQTAADRRRTQIRLAQRAYRQRKETTISSLKKQVSDLHKTIDEMSNGFLEFHALAIQSGIVNERPSFGRELNALLERFTTLAKNANKVAESSDGEERGGDEVVTETATSSGIQDSATSGLSHIVAAAAPNAGPRHEASFTDIPLGYQIRIGTDTSDSSSGRTSEEPTSGDFPSASLGHDSALLMQRMTDPISTNYFPWMAELSSAQGSDGQIPQYDALFPTQPTNADTLDQTTPFDPSIPLTLLDGPFSNHIPEPELVGSMLMPGPNIFPGLSTRMGLPYTFSFQESTFSRRLNRAAIERAFHLISQAEIRPQRFNKVFRLTLMYWTREEIRARLETVLGRTTQESLDTPGGPFQHLGGSGTHYPQKDGQGNLIPRPETFNERCIGPIRTVIEREAQAMGKSALAALQRSGADDWAVLEGYAGEWFDANDVSGYLEERGVKIPAQATFVEGEIEEELDAATAAAAAATASSGGTEVQDPINLAYLFAPNSTALSGMASGADEPVDREGADTHRIIQNQAVLDRTAAQQKKADDYFNFAPQDSFLASLEKPNAFTSSAWFDEPQRVGTEYSSPGLTSGTTASSIQGGSNEMMEWMVDKPLKRKKVVTIEVAKLIDELIRRGVCIGRSPGFRRKDVDEALKASIISVF